jgi:hypothetical protein
MLVSQDRDASNLFPRVLVPGQRLIQIRELGGMYMSCCDPAEVVSAMFLELVPRCAKLAGPQEYWLRDFADIPEQFRTAVFVCWTLLWMRDEFSDVLFWGQNKDEDRNPRFQIVLEQFDIVGAGVLAEMQGGEGMERAWMVRALDQVSKLRGICQSFAEPAIRARVCGAMYDSMTVALRISGRAGGSVDVFIDRIRVMLGLSEVQEKHFVDKCVTEKRVWPCETAARSLRRAGPAGEHYPRRGKGVCGGGARSGGG